MSEAFLMGKKGGGGGGGLALTNANEIERYVYQGETINEGDFVKYIDKILVAGEDAVIQTLENTSYAGYFINGIELSSGRFLITHRSGTYLKCSLYRRDDGQFTLLTSTTLSNENSYYGVDMLELADGRVFIAFGNSSSYYLYGAFLTITDSSISVSTATSICSGARSAYRKCKLIPFSNNRILIFHSYETSFYLYYTLITFSGDTITINAQQAISSSSSSANSIGAVKVNDTDVLVLYRVDSSSNSLGGTLCTVSGTSVTLHNANTVLDAGSYAGTYVSTVQPLSVANRFLVVHSTNGSEYNSKGSIVEVNGTSFSIVATTTIDSTKNSANRAPLVLVPVNGNYPNLHFVNVSNANYNILGMYLWTNDDCTTINYGTPFVIDDSVKYTWFNYAWVMPISDLSNVISLLYAHTTSLHATQRMIKMLPIDGFSNTVIDPIVEEQVMKATESPFNGIAKTSGVGGTATENNDSIIVYVPSEVSE